MPQPLSDPLAPLRRIAAEPDAVLDIAGLALALAAAARPNLDLAPYQAHLAGLVGAVARDAAARQPSADAAAAALRAVLVDAQGYLGDTETYDDLQNADLARVIDRRRGLPVALAILWLHAGRGQGWAMAGLGFPGHFLIRLDAAGGRMILDPFNAGRRLDTDDLRALLKQMAGPDAELSPQHYAPVSDRAVLLRLQNNIKLRLIRDNDFPAALAVLERMALLAPADPALWHETALIQERLGSLRAALASFEQAHKLAQTPASRHRIAADLSALRGRLN